MSKRLKPPRYDPTINTHHLVKGTAEYQDGMRRELDKRLKLTAKYIHRLKTQEFRMQDAARVAESKRIDEQLHLRDAHDREKADMMGKWTDATAAAFSTALNAGLKTSNDRLDRLEKFMYEQSGRGQGLSTSWGVIIAVAGVILAAAAVYLKT
jgi:hypothetical protein